MCGSAVSMRFEIAGAAHWYSEFIQALGRVSLPQALHNKNFILLLLCVFTDAEACILCPRCCVSKPIGVGRGMYRMSHPVREQAGPRFLCSRSLSHPVLPAPPAPPAPRARPSHPVPHNTYCTLRSCYCVCSQLQRRASHVPFSVVQMGRDMYLRFRLSCGFRRTWACTLCSGYFVGSDRPGHVPWVPAILWVQKGRGMYIRFRLFCGFRWAEACTLGSGYLVGSESHGHVLYVSDVADPDSEFICAGCS